MWVLSAVSILLNVKSWTPLCIKAKQICMSKYHISCITYRKYNKLHIKVMTCLHGYQICFNFN